MSPPLGWKYRLATQLGLIALLGFLPVAGILGWNVHTTYRHAYDDALRTQQRIVEDGGKRLQNSLHTAQAMLAALAGQPKVRSGDVEACSGFLSRMAASFDFTYTLFSRADRHGLVDCSSLGTAPVAVGLTPNIRQALLGRLGLGA